MLELLLPFKVPSFGKCRQLQHSHPGGFSWLLVAVQLQAYFAVCGSSCVLFSLYCPFICSCQPDQCLYPTPPAISSLVHPCARLSRTTQFCASHPYYRCFLHGRYSGSLPDHVVSRAHEHRNTQAFDWVRKGNQKGKRGESPPTLSLNLLAPNPVYSRSK